jgi:hypothetical protein
LLISSKRIHKPTFPIFIRRTCAELVEAGGLNALPSLSMPRLYQNLPRITVIPDFLFYPGQSWIMLIIAEKLDFQTGTRVEVYQRNDNQPPNSLFCEHCG